MRRLTIPDWFFFFILLVVSVIFIIILAPYIIDIFLAGILAHLFKKIHFLFKIKFHITKHLAAFLSVLVAIIVIFIPLSFIAFLLSNEAINAFKILKNKIPDFEKIFQLLDKIPFMGRIADLIQQFDIQGQLTQFITTSSGFIANLIQQTFVNVGFKVFHLMIVLIVMYFFLIDGKKLFHKILSLSPLQNRDERMLFNEMIKITDATLVGTIIIGIIEGAFGGILFALFGLPSPIFWGVIMTLVSVIPIIGVNSILVPTGIILILTGRIVAGISIICLSYGGSTITQNYLKPYLVSRRGGLHPAIVLLSTLGGLSYFGLVGFLLGPIIAALFIATWNQFGRHFQQELDDWNKDQDFAE
ncbi:AI-2E family transporter [Candidatus Margulisiibacteriota bacterium]